MSDLATPVMPDKKKGYDKYELDNAVETLQRAEEIKADKKLMKALGPHLAKKVKAITSVAQLREVGRKKTLDEAETKDEAV